MVAGRDDTENFYQYTNRRFSRCFAEYETDATDMTVNNEITEYLHFHQCSNIREPHCLRRPVLEAGVYLGHTLYPFACFCNLKPVGPVNGL